LHIGLWQHAAGQMERALGVRTRIKLRLPSQIDSRVLSFNKLCEVILILESGHEVNFCIRWEWKSV